MKISELRLFTSDLDAQRKFYSSLFNLKLIHDGGDHFSVQVGTSVLTFMLGEDDPIYHFAVNIPYHLLYEGLEWTKKRVEVQPMHDSEIVDFPGWNAKAFYFYDPGGNIVEFIGRRNLETDKTGPFSQDSLMHISEVGFPTADVRQSFEQLEKYFELEKYDGNFKEFCAVGDETGLFIVVNYNTKKWIPNMDDAQPFPFRIIFENSKGQAFDVAYEEEQLRLLNCY